MTTRSCRIVLITSFHIQLLSTVLATNPKGLKVSFEQPNVVAGAAIRQFIIGVSIDPCCF